MSLKRKCRYRRLALALVTVPAALATAVGYGVLRASLPHEDGLHRLAGLSAAAEATLDKHGIPRITAQTREDAYRILGYVTARDRLFQMDLLRRNAAGRLAEILGPELVPLDRRHRVMGLAPVADAVLARLPDAQQAVLRAYAAGVNQAMDGMTLMAPEFLLLGYRPAAWRPQDSLLVVLGMHENLTWSSDLERTLTVLQTQLPAPVYTFLTPPVDRYTDQVLHGDAARHRPPAIPEAALAAYLSHALRGQAAGGGLPATMSDTHAIPRGGSNAWVIGPGKTHDGRALLANDMHLALSVPNIWYRAELHYAGRVLSGFTLPGVPLLIAGSNGRVAWGFTSIGGDYSDLVTLDIDPNDAGRYRTPAGWARFGKRTETMAVRAAPAQSLEVRTTQWGPVLPEPLLGQAVALRWTALDPAATDLEFLDLDGVDGVNAALALFNRAGSPPLNALVADAAGHIGWTYAGKIPQRYGLDGTVSRSWADGARGWDGYIAAQAFPRSVDPPSGFIVNANQRMLDARYPHAIGNNYANGYRAFRISERLAHMRAVDEPALLRLQLDTRAEFFRYYQQLALSLLPVGAGPAEQRLQRALVAWDGHAERESRGLAIIVEFRRLLLEAVLGPYLADCRRLEPACHADWLALDEPLQQLLDAKLPALLPDNTAYPDWNAWLHALLVDAERNVLARYQAAEPDAVTWGVANTAAVAHPFSAAFSWLKPLLDMPAEALAGCVECVRWNADGGGASERLVVSPGREAAGILHMPTGQSGHPLSPHYRDQHPAWVEGAATPLPAGAARHRLQFLPQRSEAAP